MEHAAPRYQTLKMHGLGNDFVIFDMRHQTGAGPDAVMARAVADRHFGIGCDTVVTLLPGTGDTEAVLAFQNADGSAASACGNATRCAAKLLMAETGKDRLTLATHDPGSNTLRALPCEAADDGLIRVNMGPPVLDWAAIPLAHAVDIDALPLPGTPSAVAMPNPHCVFFVEDAEAVDLSTRGRAVEHDPLFPDRTNVEFISLTGPDRLRMRVWERGGMITLACGSGACAAVVAAHRRGLTGRTVAVDLDGGRLMIDWHDDGVWMTGPASHVAHITLAPDLLGAS